MKENKNEPEISQTAEGSNNIQAANSTVSVVFSDSKSRLEIILISLLVPYICISAYAGFAMPSLAMASFLLLCISPFSISALVMSILAKSRRAIALSVLAVIIWLCAFAWRYFAKPGLL